MTARVPPDVDKSAEEGSLKSAPSHASYGALYERHAQRHAAFDAIGGGEYDIVGRVELGALRMEGLRPS